MTNYGRPSDWIAAIPVLGLPRCNGRFSRGGTSFMAEKSADSPVRIIGSRELHQNLPGILRELENDTVRYVLTVHGRPRAVLIGAEPYLSMIANGRRPSEALVSLQLTALLGGKLDAEVSTISKGPRQTIRLIAELRRLASEPSSSSRSASPRAFKRSRPAPRVSAAFPAAEEDPFVAAIRGQTLQLQEAPRSQ